MTVKECLDLFDAERRNTVPDTTKLGWLTDLDSFVYAAYARSRKAGGSEPALPYTDRQSEEELLIKTPFTDAYFFWLDIKYDLFLGDADRFNNDKRLFDNALDEYAAFLTRSGGYSGKKLIFNV